MGKQLDNDWLDDVYWCSWLNLVRRNAIGIRTDIAPSGISINGIVDPLIWKPLGSWCQQ
jgi:hypothetical protein